MFEKLINLIKGVFDKLFRRDVLNEKINVEIALSDQMVKQIELWAKLYHNNPPWLSDTVHSMNLPASIASELARLATIEFKSKVEDPVLDKEYQLIVDDIRKYCEQGCATGGIAFKPYFDDEVIAIDVISAEHFYPTAYDNQGKITGAIFIDQLTKGETLYTKLENHSLNQTNYTIQNHVFKTKLKNNLVADLGDMIPLSSVNEWSDLEERITIENVKRPLFAYFKMPGVNLIDNNSPVGFSCFGKAIDLIEQADKQYSRILWEYEGSELAVNADASLFKRDYSGNEILPKGKERLYRTFNIQPSDTGTNKISTFSPEIRDTSLFNGLDNLLKRIEFSCGLSYGTISDPITIDRTATEIIQSKQRLYSTVKDIQKSLQVALEDLVYVLGVWSTLKGLKVNINALISFSWDDSIIIDKQAELLSMQQDVMGDLIRPEIYIARKYGVTETEALRMMPKASEAIKTNPFGNNPEAE